MRNLIQKLLLTSAAACLTIAPAAFAADQATATVPFAFQAHGKAYPAGKYVVELDSAHNLVTIRTKELPIKSFSWTVGPGDYTGTLSHVRLTFDDVGAARELHTIEFGDRITASLDQPSRREMRSSGSASGQN